MSIEETNIMNLYLLQLPYFVPCDAMIEISTKTYCPLKVFIMSYCLLFILHSSCHVVCEL